MVRGCDGLGCVGGAGLVVGGRGGEGLVAGGSGGRRRGRRGGGR